MALTKVSRGLLSTGIVDNSNATAITLNADESATFAGAISVTGTATATSLLTTGAIASTAVDGTVVDRSGTTSRFVAGRSGGNYAGLEMHVAGASGVTKRFSINYDSTTKLFAPNGTSEHLVITSAGDVGIGVAAPAALLNIAHASHGIALGFEGATLPVTAGMYTSSSTNFGQAYGSLVIQSRTDYAGYSTIFRGNGGEAMRIDGATGNVGVSVIPPAWGSAYANVNVGTSGSFWGSKTGASLVAMSDNSYFNGSAYIARNTGAGSKYYQNAGGHYWDNAASVSAGAAQTNVERMRLDASGRLLINTTSILSGSSAKLQVLQDVAGQWSQRINNSTTHPYGLAISYTSASPNNTLSQFHYCVDSTGARWGVYSNGGVLNYSGNNVNLSDRNAKKDITIHTDNEWNCVKAWEIVDYRYKDEADDSPAKIGVIAQQIQEHCPDLVNVFQEQADAVEEVLGEDGEVVTEAKAAVEKRIGVNEAQMMWKVTKALQEAMTRIETLEAKVQTLENT